MIVNTMNNNNNVDYYDTNYCKIKIKIKIEFDCNLNDSKTTMIKLHTTVGTIDFSKLLGNGFVHDCRSINDSTSLSSDTFEQTTVLMTNSAINNTFILSIDNITTVTINDAFDGLNE